MTRRYTRRFWLTAGAAAFALTAVAVGTWVALAPAQAHGHPFAQASTHSTHSARAVAPTEPSSPTASATTPAAAQGPTATAPAVQAAQTQVITISPWKPDGTPAGGITVTDRAGDSCFGTAESTMRTDAWRCTAGDRILDPCFSPDSNPQNTAVLCMDGAPDRMVKLSVPQGLPGNNDHMRRRCHLHPGRTAPELRLRQRRGSVRVPVQGGSGVEHLLRRARRRQQRLHADHHGLSVAARHLT